jgi:ElaB/YqjD/DUF883 family membrane-anchored ribosome-binding protein
MTMSNDPTTTPTGETDLSLGGKTGRGRSVQNLEQAAESAARTGAAEVDKAFGAAASAASNSLKEARTFLDKDEARRMAGKAKDAAAETMSTLTDKVNAARDQVQRSAEVARDWTMKRAEEAADSAKRLQAERPIAVLSVSAGAALAVGLLAGFVIGRATADDY